MRALFFKPKDIVGVSRVPTILKPEAKSRVETLLCALKGDLPRPSLGPEAELRVGALLDALAQDLPRPFLEPKIGSRVEALLDDGVQGLPRLFLFVESSSGFA